MKVIYDTDKQKVPIKMWLDEIEDGAVKQLVNLSNLPFAFKHIAVMPDCHQGFGMPIGGVLATKKVVIPNAVGVDIGCFTGDTKVKLTDGRDLSFLELIKEYNRGKENFCYSLDKESNIVISKINSPRKTRIANELLEIKLDNNEIIKCTKDHIFYDRENKEIRAKKLKIGQSLMPIYINKAFEVEDIEFEHQFKKEKMKDYNVIYNPKNNKYRYIHILADEFNILNGIYKKTKGVRHHIDFNKYNNNPTNIKRVNWKKHWEIHYKNVGKNSKLGIVGFKIARKNNPILFSKMASENMRKLHQRKDFQEIVKKNAIQNWINYSKTEKFKEQAKLAGERGKKFLIQYNKSEKGRVKSSEIGKKYGFGAYWNKNRKNHKIISIKLINKKEDVYCLTIDKYHNFALSSGVFVHNCGMCAVKTSLKSEQLDRETLKKIMGKIREVIPVGNGRDGSHKERQDENLMPIKAETIRDMLENYNVIKKEYFNALKQIGTLGGGNHFIEIQKDTENNIWIMIHSGSRNLGYKVANYYNELAKNLNGKWYVYVPKECELAFLPIETQEAKDYMLEMQYCVDFALANRFLMMSNIVEIFNKEFNDEGFYLKDINNQETGCGKATINIAHNYAIWENHFGENVIVHRKGATLAREGTIGIIPGSQGTKSYIVKGLGNKESFESCSHGAGRVMGRKEACRQLNLKEEIKILDDQGIIHGIRNVNNLEEASGAYKKIEDVMKNQSDLVEILVELSPLAVIKGD